MIFIEKQKREFIELTKEASQLIIEIAEEEKIFNMEASKLDKKFMGVICSIYEISPQISDGYVSMYNYIQKEKISPEDDYYKRIRRVIKSKIL